MRKLRCECGNVVELIDEQESLMAGQTLTCPKCGLQKKVRPRVLPIIERFEDRPLVVTHYRKPSWFSRIPLVKKLMLIATALWPLLAAFCVDTTARTRLSPYWANRTPRPQDWDFMFYEQHVSDNFQKSIVPGLIYSTTIYGVVVSVLFVVWFATMPSASTREA